jgi:hypothetical protein
MAAGTHAPPFRITPLSGEGRVGLFVPSSGGRRRDGVTNRLWRNHSLLHPLDAQAAGQSAAPGHLADRTQSARLMGSSRPKTELEPTRQTQSEWRSRRGGIERICDQICEIASLWTDHVVVVQDFPVFNGCPRARTAPDFPRKCRKAGFSDRTQAGFDPGAQALAALDEGSRDEPRLRTDDPVDVVRHGHIFVGDAALGVCHQRKSHRPPTDIDVGVMISRFGVVSHPAHRIDTCEECRKLDRPAQRALRPLPSVEVRQCGINLLIR